MTKINKMTKYQQKRLRLKFRNYLKGIYHKITLQKIPQATEIQSKAFDIIKKLANNSKSELIPLAGYYYIRYKSYYIRFNTTHAIVKNSKFSYFVEYDYLLGEKIVEYFYHCLEKRKNKIDKEFDVNTVKNLEEILKSIQ